MSDIPLPSGPELEIRSWVEKGPERRAHDPSGGKGDVLHLEITRDLDAERNWLKYYLLGLEEFHDERIKQAREHQANDRHPQSIACAKIIAETPLRERSYAYNLGAVVDAWESIQAERNGESLPINSLKPSNLPSLERMMDARYSAFRTPEDRMREADFIIGYCRQKITENEVQAWTTAANAFGDNNDLHPAAVCAYELGLTHELRDSPEAALRAFGAGALVLNQYMRELQRKSTDFATGKLSAEHDTVKSHITAAQLKVIEHIRAKSEVVGADKERLKLAAYNLDDVGGPNRYTLVAYQLLQQSHRLFSSERKFFKGEAARIAGYMAVARMLDRNPGVGGFVGGPVLRRKDISKRPAIELGLL